MHYFVAVLCIFISSHALAAASEHSLQNAISLYQRGQYPQAIDALTPYAEQGDVQAQRYLALSYHEDPAKFMLARTWYLKAARQGDKVAQFNLGGMFYSGEGGEQDFSQALHWYELAAKQGNKYAQHALGVIYEYGYGVRKDPDKSLEYYQLAAKQGYEPSIEALPVSCRTSDNPQ